jgi:hypothetical protein
MGERMRVVGLAPDTDVAHEREGHWLVHNEGDQWTAQHVPGGTSMGSVYYTMIVDYMKLLGLTRCEPDPEDPPTVVERWVYEG